MKDRLTWLTSDPLDGISGRLCLPWPGLMGLFTGAVSLSTNLADTLCLMLARAQGKSAFGGVPIPLHGSPIGLSPTRPSPGEPPKDVIKEKTGAAQSRAWRARHRSHPF
ncbi:MAG: hypothetical protein AAF501_21725, partial [Pseudomonadota bacterium]